MLSVTSFLAILYLFVFIGGTSTAEYRIMERSMKLSGHTKPFAVLGHPIGHTLSPVMHNAAISAMGIDAVYMAFDVPPDELLRVLKAMQIMGFGGVNLTVPLKEIGFRDIDDLDDSARKLGAVNTVEFTDAGIRGHNTDGAGFIKAIEKEFRLSMDGLSVFILGAGGAGRAVAITAASMGADSVKISDINAERCARLTREMDIFPDCKTTIAPPSGGKLFDAVSGADLIIQATPVGMKETDRSPLPPEAFNKKQKAFDLVYMYPETDFMKNARSAGASAANGLSMLMFQGAVAFRIWTDKEPPAEAMMNALEKEVYKEVTKE